jgi:hypothetical protein
VIVACASHWACGWVETILIHKSAKKKLDILRQAKADLDDYPLLDEDDFYERESEEAAKSIDEYAPYDAAKTLTKALGLEAEPEYEGAFEEACRDLMRVVLEQHSVEDWIVTDSDLKAWASKYGSDLKDNQYRTALQAKLGIKKD